MDDMITKEEAITALPWRELDVAIDTQVFGQLSGFASLRAFRENGNAVPYYSTQIDHAWLVAEKLKIGVMPRDDGWIAFKQGSEWGDSGYIWDLGIDIPLIHFAEAETAPHAICLCALKVVCATLDP